MSISSGNPLGPWVASRLNCLRVGVGGTTLIAGRCNLFGPVNGDRIGPTASIFKGEGSLLSPELRSDQLGDNRTRRRHGCRMTRTHLFFFDRGDRLIPVFGGER